MKVLTVATALNYLKAAVLGNPHTAIALELDLYRTVLKAIANEEPGDKPAALAEAALRAQYVNFPR